MVAEVFNLATPDLSASASFLFASGRKVSCVLMGIHKAAGKSQKYFFGGMVEEDAGSSEVPNLL